MRNFVKATVAALVLAATSTSSQAAEMFFYWKYESPTVLRGITLQDAVVIQDINTGSGYDTGYGLLNGQTLDSNFDFAFNITDALNNLLHTYTFSGVQGAKIFSLTFASAPVAPISPVAGPNVVATGGIQNVAGFVAGADKYTMAFQIAAVAPVPEPATWAMMIIGFGAAGSMIRRRKAVVA